VRSSQGWGLRQCCHKSNYQAVGWFDGWLVGWKPTIKLTNQQTFPESLSSYPQKDKGGNCASPVFLLFFASLSSSAVSRYVTACHYLQALGQVDKLNTF
jgi:hypothetical protein